MENLEKLITVFAQNLGLPSDSITDSLSYGTPPWDSVAHLAIVAGIEGAFEIMMDTEDVIGMSSVARAKEIVRRHGITLES